MEEVKRVEFRTDGKVENSLREEVERRRKTGAGLSEHGRRIASLIVFVDEDGEERKLLEA